MRVLVTGVTGFAGGHLAEALLDQGRAEVFGTSRRGDWPPFWRHLAGRVELAPVDLCDSGAVEAVLRQVRPEQVYHLAGYAHVGQSFQQVEAAWAGNLTATLCLLEALVRTGLRPRVLYVGSGLVYGEPEGGEQAAFDETSPLRPASPYASSKAAADLVASQYARAPGLDVVRVRPFNHIGPRQSPQYAVAHFAQQLVAVERGQRPPVLETGNLSPLRDLTDVRDMVRAYLLLMERGRTGEVYNAASGEVHSMREVLDRLLAHCPVPVTVRQRADLVRPRETAAARGDAARLRRETGWAPQFSLDQTLADTLTFWRQQS